MMPRKIICLVIDRLRAAALGAYGAAWCETPALDRLASESFLCDQALLPAQGLEAVYRALWRGDHPLAPAVGQAALPAALREAGFRTTLLTDEPTVAEHPLAEGFEDRLRLPSPPANAPAASLQETQLADFFVAAVGALEQLEELEEQEADRPALLWLHARGMAGPWDAPLAARDSLVDEEDPPPPRGTEVPSLVLPADFDPDVPLGYTYAYAGQVIALDACVAALLDHFRQSPLVDDALFVLLGARGFPLGEHRRVGGAEEILYGEAVQVPWLMRFPDGLGRLARSGALVQPGDLPATLLDWLGLEGRWIAPASRSLLPLVRGEAEQVRDRLCLTTTSGGRAIRTRDWHAIFPPGDEPAELYVKPDDRWEFNEVANRAPEAVAELREAHAQFEQAASNGRLAELGEI
jgi:arylsulfatase A-like enzyme